MNRREKFRRLAPRAAGGALLAAALCACAATSGFKAADIRSSEDSIALGRIRFRLGAGCEKSLNLPQMELRSLSGRTSIPYDIPDLSIAQKDQPIELPFVQKVSPGTYALRIKVVEGPWDPTWLDAGMLSLVEFEVPRGFLVYFGTIEIDISCEDHGRHGEDRYVDHAVHDEHELELLFFKEEYPDVYQMYENRIIHSLPKEPWKRS